MSKDIAIANAAMPGYRTPIIPVTNKTVKLPLSMTFTGKRAS